MLIRSERWIFGLSSPAFTTRPTRGRLPPATVLKGCALVVVMVVMVMVVEVHLLVDRNMDWVWDVLVDGDVLHHWHMHLLNVMVVVGVHLVRNVDHDVLAEEEKGGMIRCLAAQNNLNWAGKSGWS